MNTKIIILALGVTAMTGCSSAYKMGQTPDDVYYSPAKEQVAYVAAEKTQERYLPQDSYGYNNYNGYNDYDMYRNDRFLRMSIGNRMRYSAYNDLYMMDPYYNPYYSNGFNTIGYNYNNPWNSYYYWNSFYNPYSSFNVYYSPHNYYPNYGSGGIVTKPGASINNTSRPRLFSPNNYTNNSYNNSNIYLYRNPSAINTQQANSTRGTYNNSNNTSERYYNNTNTNQSRSRTRTYYNDNTNNSYVPSGSSNNNSYSAPSRSTTVDSPTRSYTPSSSSGSSGSSSGSSGGGGGISRPSRSN